MSRARRILIAVAGAACLVAPAADAGVAVKGVDTSAYPVVRVSVLTSDPSSAKPTLYENGHKVFLSRAENLGRAKSVVLAIDHHMRNAPTLRTIKRLLSIAARHGPPLGTARPGRPPDTASA